MPVTSSSVLARAAAHLNDSLQLVYTPTVLLPFLAMAIDELSAELRVYEVTPLIIDSSNINVSAAATEITPIPADFVDAITILERSQGSSEDLIEITEVNDLDDNLAVHTFDTIKQWAVRNKRIFINPPTTAREVKLSYLRGLISPTVDNNIDIDEARWFLGLVTAKNAARDLGNAPTKAASYESDITRSRDRLIRALQKGNQSIGGARRKPYTGRNR